MKSFYLILIILFLLNCETKQDPRFVWLLGIAESTATSTIVPSHTGPNASQSTNPAPEGTQNYSVSIYDVEGSTNFLFEPDRTINISMSVVNAFGDAATGAYVSVVDVNNAEANAPIFRATVEQNGTINGTFTVNATTNAVDLVINYNGQTIRMNVDIKGILSIDRHLILTLVTSPITVVDSDKDGIPDEEDAYPNDATRATKVLYPREGYYTVAFEDLFPTQGDADFNDLAVRVRYEEDLNAKGEVVRVRGYYQNVAKGAGYNHILRLTLPGVANSSYTVKNYSANDVLEKEITNQNTQAVGIDLFPASNLTNSQSNTSKNQSFIIGKKSEVEVILTEPISKTTLGSVPYDLYIYVNNTKKEIHFAGKYFDINGKDIYLDSNGFPWAVMIHGNWKWPYEKTNVHNSYPKFENWYKSKGTQDLDWYNFPDLRYVFPSF